MGVELGVARPWRPKLRGLAGEFSATPEPENPNPTSLFSCGASADDVQYLDPQKKNHCRHTSSPHLQRAHVAYQAQQERFFIFEIIAQKNTKYSFYAISWVSS